ncbi:hypothetical protein ANN_15775 [Periplaneta americana]|uniref:Uncharacterized protein n=1 Tax=Periplaneta americana TaxID=6978 RepID=A0ABQ8SIC4_PERAM|nr:hypothetical protein ANN_15775 [Periplaneta americana]
MLFAKVYQRASETGTSTVNRSDCGAPRQQWIGRGVTIAWPARSPVLTPLDYFLWGDMKRLIYETPLESEEDLLARLWLRRILDYQVLVMLLLGTASLRRISLPFADYKVAPASLNHHYGD